MRYLQAQNRRNGPVAQGRMRKAAAVAADRLVQPDVALAVDIGTAK